MEIPSLMPSRKDWLSGAIFRLLDVVPSIILFAPNTNGGAVFANLAAQKIFRGYCKAPHGKSQAHACQLSQLTVFDNEGQPVPAADHPLRRAMRGEGVQNAEIELRFGDGDTTWLRGDAVPLQDEHGEVWGALGTFTDITQSKRMEAALEHANAQLEARVTHRTQALSEAARELASEMRRREQVQAALLQAQKLDALGQMTSGIAHDFRNVLQAVSSSYQVLRLSIDNPKLRHIIDQGELAVERANRLVGQLLAFARREELKPQAIDLTAMLPAFKELAGHSLTPGITCQIEIEGELWPVLADQRQLEVAVLNLVVNSRDAMPNGGTIRISARKNAKGVTCSARPGLPPRDCTVIAVSDTGCGMPPEVIRRATHPFFTTKGPDKGNGLGLAMVDDFARRSGGAISIESEMGKGTTVSIALPRADTDDDLLHPTVHLASNAAPHGNAVILLVDDDEQLRRITATFLRSLHYSVVEAASAEAAYTLAHTVQRLDLLITDVVLPGAGGSTLVDRMREDRPNLPIIFITGHSGGIPATSAPVLHKPFCTADLARLVLKELGRESKNND